MHELGLCQAIVGAIEKRAGERAVARVRIRVGRLHHVHPEAFEQSFAMAANGSVAEGATAELVLLPIRCLCRACGVEFNSEEVAVACPRCNGIEVEVVGGDELTLESLEYRA